ncbi:T9SS sorting signal type C domain-containing protein [Flavobacterium sp. AS60]|uniref:T9SS sorting signal type C domain-containing protein n=1 Tax=Flavobacterium anseongense TaxID=2910677 RepID=UPI001F48AE88|nr:T9SS sorting signal type C domain-containing protein [Flavobacterium sp. AS60]MCF6130520.1 T9SS sorting signal type C domain-containing protein [Flavobacterium sp. AS60]
MKTFLLSLFVSLLFSLGLNAQCTITGTTVNASTLTCSSFSGCTTVYVGNGTTATTLNMNADLNLSCLGTIQFIIRNNASVDFSPGNNRLTLGSGSSLTIETGGNIIGGSCNASERIYVGTNLLASCNGGAGADLSFTTLISLGGTGSLTSNSPVCTSNTINLLATPPPNGTYTYSFFGTGLPGGGTAYSSSPSYSVTAPGTAGSYLYQVYMKSSLSGNPISVAEITVVVNSGLATSTPIVTVTQPTCTVATGTITVTSPTGTGMTYSTNGITYTNTTGIFTPVSSGTYSVTAKNSSGCISPATSATVNTQTNTWSSSGWSSGSPPTSSQKIVFTHDYTSPTDISGCSCQVSSGAITISSGHTLTVADDIKILGSGSLTFEDQASLVQTNNSAANVGSITYKRRTTALKQYDYTYWSSPVVSATLSQLATNSLMYSFSPITNLYVYQTGATTMAQGVGYIGRAPSGLTYAPTQIVQTSFVGAPGNGVINTPIIKNTTAYNLIGNPYPSALNADSFIAANSSVINGTLYFWTHNTAITNNVYTVNDYAKYNYTGAVGTAPAPSGGPTPTGKIAAAQGFFVEAKTSLANGTYSATFNNAMRLAGNNTQFFKGGTQANNTTSSISEGLERHRVWLSLRSPQGAYNQMLVGYVQGATNDFDSLFDGKTFAVGNSVSIYTRLGADILAIQGKSLPFSEADVIPFAYSTIFNGELTIYLDNFDGVFTTQNVYLLDKVTNTLHNLKESPYAFVTTNGSFEERFELRFTDQALGTTIPTITDNDIKIITANHQLEILSPAMAITKVEVYDILGKLLFTQNDLNTNLFQTSSLQIAPQVLLVKVTLDNGQSFTKKTLMN